MNCVGKIDNVGYLPQYGGSLLSVSMDYRGGILAHAFSSDYMDKVMSIMLTAFIADKEVSIQWKTLGATTCKEIEQWSGGIAIERITILK